MRYRDNLLISIAYVRSLKLVTKTYRGDMTKVGASVAVTGVMCTNDALDKAEIEVGYFNMIDATDERLGYENEDP